MINGRWTDADGNTWDGGLSEEYARRSSNSLTNCSDCSDCSYCSYCSNCRNCSDCSDCSDCSYCNSFHSNPQRYVTSPIGSRKDQTTFYWDSTRTQVVCGCFVGNLTQFSERVNKVYPPGTKHGDEYRQEIAKARTLIGAQEGPDDASENT